MASIPGQVAVVVHGIDLAAVRATADRAGVRRELGIDDADVVIVCVANLRREKALDVLVAAATTALGEEARLRYLLVGQGPLATDVDRWIAEAGIGSRFTALGYREDATRIISAADALTLSSAHEGLPVAVMEALALGVPVVATAAGGVPGAVGAAGLISAVGDAEALAEHHLLIARDATRRNELTRAAAAEAPRFELTRAVAEIEAVYRVALQESASAGAPTPDSSHS